MLLKWFDTYTEPVYHLKYDMIVKSTLSVLKQKVTVLYESETIAIYDLE